MDLDLPKGEKWVIITDQLVKSTKPEKKESIEEKIVFLLTKIGKNP